MLLLRGVAGVGIFISYSHKDNARLTPAEAGWVDVFHTALERRLAMLRGADTEVWRDPKISGSDALTEIIQQRIDASEILISVLSPGYLNSSWGADELRWFVRRYAGQVLVGTKSRVVKVIKLPDKRQADWGGPPLTDMTGWPFYKNSALGAPLEFDPVRDQEFMNKVNDLAWVITETLAELPEEKQSVSLPLQRMAAPTGISIYVAETTYDLTGERERLRRELEQFGHTVVASGALRPELPGYAERVTAALQSCRLSVHPVGNGSGNIPAGERFSAVKVQYARAADIAAARKDLIVVPWIPPGVAATDDQQRAFIEELQNDARLLIAPLEQLKTRIGDLLAAKPVAAAAGAAPQSRSIYLIADPVDADASRPVAAHLRSRGFDIALPLSRGTATEQRSVHEDNLQTADAVLIFYGRTSELWLRKKQNDLRKLSARSRAPLRARAVLLADPRTPEKDDEFGGIAAYGTFAPAMLQGFIDELDRGGESAT